MPQETNMAELLRIMEKMIVKVDDLDKKVDVRMDRLETRMEGFETRMDRLEVKVDTVADKVIETKRILNGLEGRVDTLESESH